jgi:ankyrin repeat protein
MNTAAAKETFVDAMRDRNIGLLEEYMSRGFNVNQTLSGPENTPIIVEAVKLGYPDVFATIMRGNPDVNKADVKGYTPLLMLIKTWDDPDINTFNTLIAKGANTEHANRSGVTAFMLLLVKYNKIPDLFRKLIYITLFPRVINVNRRNKSGIPLLIYAISTNAVKPVKDLLQKGADPDMAESAGHKHTPLYHAIKVVKNADIAKALVDAGADMDIIDAKNGTSLLWEAVMTFNQDILRAAIRMDPDLDIQNTNANGETPLIAACKEGFLEGVEMLVEDGADINRKDASGKTPLDYAYADNDPDIIDYLTQHGATATTEPPPPEENNVGESLATRAKPANAPAKCFDPILHDDVNVETADVATFYILGADDKVISAGCLDEASLEQYITGSQFIFYRCKETVPVSALFIGQDNVYPEQYRLFNFGMKTYIKAKEAYKLKVGSAYVLKPEEPIGRIASFSVVYGGNVVSANHCGPADGSILYSVHKIVPSGGKRHTRVRTQRRKNKKQRKSTRRVRR